MKPSGSFQSRLLKVIGSRQRHLNSSDRVLSLSTPTPRQYFTSSSSSPPSPNRSYSSSTSSPPTTTAPPTTPKEATTPSALDSTAPSPSQLPDEHPALPAPGSTPAQPVLEVGGPGVRLDTVIGPLIVNKDGSLARIENWGKMTEGEQSDTLRIIRKRNEQRLQKLRAEAGISGNETQT